MKRGSLWGRREKRVMKVRLGRREVRDVRRRAGVRKEKGMRRVGIRGLRSSLGSAVVK